MTAKIPTPSQDRTPNNPTLAGVLGTLPDVYPLKQEPKAR